VRPHLARKEIRAILANNTAPLPVCNNILGRRKAIVATHLGIGTDANYQPPLAVEDSWQSWDGQSCEPYHGRSRIRIPLCGPVILVELSLRNGSDRKAICGPYVLFLPW
jgi:hypothetical protein